MLNAWPITQDQVAMYAYPGSNPDSAITDMLDEVGDHLQSATYSEHLAETIVDPFVFMQFVTGLQGKYTVNGSPFYQNWRLLPNARRMAARLGADTLATQLAAAETAIKGYDPSLLDAYDRSDTETLGQDRNDQLFELLDKQFQDSVNQGDCTYGTFSKDVTGGDKLLVALCEWVSAEMPREVLPDQAAVNQRLSENHAWAVNNVENYYEQWVRYYVGDDILSLLNQAGDRFGAPHNDIMTPQHDSTIVFRRFKTTEDKMNVAFMFDDAMILVHQNDMTERARVPLAKSPVHRRNGPSLRRLADKPVFGFDPDGPAITYKRLLRGPKNPMKYTQ